MERRLVVIFDDDARPRSTAMSTETNIAKKVAEDKIQSQIKTVQAKLDTLRAKAESAKANAEIKAIADLAAKKLAIDRKLNELRTSGEATYEQAKADIEARVAELEQSARAIEATFKGA
jgi:multidrug resistance efflux pump